MNWKRVFTRLACSLATVVVVLLAMMIACPSDWQSSRELIVKLRESGKPLRTMGSHAAPVFLYGADTLTIFDSLPDRDRLDIRQSFPKFSRRWQNERQWRAGRHDSTALAALPDIVAKCTGVSTADSLVIRNMVTRWSSDLAAAAAGSVGVRVVIRTLTSGGAVSKADSLAVVNLHRGLLVDGPGVGTDDRFAIPAIRRLLKTCFVGTADSIAILGFLHRVEREGGMTRLSSAALPAMLDLMAGARPTLRDSLALASYIRLIHGDDAFERPRPSASTDVSSIDLFFRIRVKDRSLNVGQLLDSLRARPEVEYAGRAIPDSRSPPVLLRAVQAAQTPRQPFLESEASGGIDAEYAWGAPGGRGDSVMIMLVDASWERHEDLPERIRPYDPPGSSNAPGARNPPGLPKASKSNIMHGTESLGVLVATHNTEGVRGICPEPRGVLFASVIRDSVKGAIDQILQDPAARPGDVLVVEWQQAVNDLPGYCEHVFPSDIPQALPVETNPDVRSAIRLATSTKYGFVVVESAGNGWKELVEIRDDFGTVFWTLDPDSLSGAIIVGAGKGIDKTYARVRESNYGERVDCQGWGRNVATTTIQFNADNSPASGYTAEFSGTSSATAMVAGIAASLQSAYIAREGRPLLSDAMRLLLRDPRYGSPQKPDEAQEHRIGPLPNLRKLLTALQIESNVD